MALQFLGTGVDPDSTTIVQPITPGIITGAIIKCTSALTDPFALYAQTGIAQNDQINPIAVKVILAEGYISLNRPQSWTGIYIMQPNDQLYLLLSGDLTQSVFADVRRLPNIAKKTLEEILATILSPA